MDNTDLHGSEIGFIRTICINSMPLNNQFLTSDYK
jgi:hypothetical protein